MTSPSTSRRRPPGRYDPPSRVAPRALAVVLALLFLALLAAVAAAFYERWAAEGVRARVIAFDVVSESRVRIDLEVTKPAGSRAYCIVRSRGADGAEVGRDVVVVDAVGSSEEVVRREHDLRTTARAVTGEVGRCRAEPIPPPREAP